MTRRGVPATVTPSHSTMGVPADQFSVALPAKASPAISNASQSDTSPVLPGSSTAPPVTQTLLDAGVPVATADQGPVPPPMTARTWRSYPVSPDRPVTAYVKPPPAPAAHRSFTTVQLEADLSADALSMYRRS